MMQTMNVKRLEKETIRPENDNAGETMEELPTKYLIERLGSDDPDEVWTASQMLVKRGKEALYPLIEGLSHSSGKVRAACALLMDHLADDRCIEPLRHAMRHDPQEAVRRCAMHSLVCDGCKECPLSTDVVEALVERLLNDRSLQVKRRAAFYLEQQRPDARAFEALSLVVQTETDAPLLRRARRALTAHKS